MERLSEPEAEQAIHSAATQAFEEKRGVILMTFENPGVLFTGVRASGMMHIQAAVRMLTLADDKSAPAKVRHHLEQAITELNKIDTYSERSSHGE